MGGCYDSSITPELIFDRDINSAWATSACTFEGQKVFYAIFKTKNKDLVTGYKMTLGNLALSRKGYNPKSWVLKAKQTETAEYQDIHSTTVTKDSCTANCHNYSYVLENPVTYEYFALVILSAQTQNRIYLGELWLLAKCTNEIETYCGCTCNREVCEYGQLCRKGKCLTLSPCPENDIAPENGCICGSIQNICDEGQFCNSKNKCLSSCPKTDTAPENGCICGSITNICTNGQFCNSNNKCLSTCPNDKTAPENGCMCRSIQNICSNGQFCNSNNKCLSSCPNDKTAPENGCMCSSIQNICSNGQFCNSNNICLSSCPKYDIAPDIGCTCGSVTNICNEGQMCNSKNICLSPCPKYDIAPEIGCICGANRNVCNEGQICYVVDCSYPPPTPVSVLFLIIGLFFALTLMFSFVLYLNLLIK